MGGGGGGGRLGGGGSLGGMYWSLLFTQSNGHGGPAVAAVSRVHRVPVLHQTAVLSYHAGGHVSQSSSLHWLLLQAVCIRALITQPFPDTLSQVFK